MSLMWWLGPFGVVATVLGFGWDSNRHFRWCGNAGWIWKPTPGGAGEGRMLCLAWSEALCWGGGPLLPCLASTTQPSSWTPASSWWCA